MQSILTQGYRFLGRFRSWRTAWLTRLPLFCSLKTFLRISMLMILPPILAMFASEDSDRIQLHVRYDRVWSRFLMEEIGCPQPTAGAAEIVQAEACTLPKVVDYRAWEESRKLAIQVYGITEERH